MISQNKNNQNDGDYTYSLNRWVSNSNLILITYEHILNEYTVSNLQLNIKEWVVIFENSFNICKQLKELWSFEISTSNIQWMISEANSLLAKIIQEDQCWEDSDSNERSNFVSWNESIVHLKTFLYRLGKRIYEFDENTQNNLLLGKKIVLIHLDLNANMTVHSGSKIFDVFFKDSVMDKNMTFRPLDISTVDYWITLIKNAVLDLSREKPDWLIGAKLLSWIQTISSIYAHDINTLDSLIKYTSNFNMILKHDILEENSVKNESIKKSKQRRNFTVSFVCFNSAIQLRRIQSLKPICILISSDDFLNLTEITSDPYLNFDLRYWNNVQNKGNEIQNN